MKFTAGFDAVFNGIGVRIIKTPVQAPRVPAVVERWIASARRECLVRMGAWVLAAGLDPCVAPSVPRLWLPDLRRVRAHIQPLGLECLLQRDDHAGETV